jgi:hypothetical protein
MAVVELYDWPLAGADEGMANSEASLDVLEALSLAQ